MRLSIVLILVIAILGVAFAAKKGKKAKGKGKEKAKPKEKAIWGYEKETARNAFGKNVYGVNAWAKKFKKCKGKAQSPINIVSKKAKKTKFGPLKLKFKGDWFEGNIVNNGHAPTFTLKKSKKNKISIKFDKKTYLLHQIHFHFGCQDKEGSEHTVDKKAFDGEMHLVFHKKKLKFEKALKKKNGLLVIGVFIKKSDNPYYYYGQTEGLDALLMPALTALSSGYVRVGSPILDVELPLKKLVPSISAKTKKTAYYTYKGSLTTPGCYESVRWVVLKKPAEISPYSLQLFRYLVTDKHGGYWYKSLCNNFRNVQKLNGRKVEHYEPKKPKKGKKGGKKGGKKKKGGKIEDVPPFQEAAIMAMDEASGSGTLDAIEQLEEMPVVEQKDTPKQESAPEQKDTPKQTSAPEQKDTPKQESAPEQKDTPKHKSAPEQKDTPKKESAPEQKDTPKQESAPEQKDTPKQEAASKQETVPKKEE